MKIIRPKLKKDLKSSTVKPKTVLGPQQKAKPQAKLKEELKNLKKRIIGLENLPALVGAHKKRKLLGRGPSSGHGKTSGRGSKGQTSRPGRDFYPGFEGGQTPLIRRIPKRGFTSINRKEYQIVNLDSLAKLNVAEISPEILEDKGLIKNKDKLVKILGRGSITSKINIKAHAFSDKAKQTIEKAGGTVEIIKV